VVQRVFPGTQIEHAENTDRRNYRVNFPRLRSGLDSVADIRWRMVSERSKRRFDLNEIGNYRDIRFSNLGFLRETGTPENKSEFDEAVMAAFGGAQIHPVVARKMTRQYLKTAPAH